MASKFGTLVYGNLAEVDAMLDSEQMSEAELRAALQNVIRHVLHLEKRIERSEDRGE